MFGPQQKIRKHGFYIGTLGFLVFVCFCCISIRLIKHWGGRWQVILDGSSDLMDLEIAAVGFAKEIWGHLVWKLYVDPARSRPDLEDLFNAT